MEHLHRLLALQQNANAECVRNATRSASHASSDRIESAIVANTSSSNTVSVNPDTVRQTHELFDDKDLELALMLSMKEYHDTPSPFIDHAGMTNVGNSCFINATLQCLLAALLNTSNDTKSAFIDALIHCDGSASSMRKLIELSGWKFDGRQHDAHEFLTVLADHVPEVRRLLMHKFINMKVCDCKTVDRSDTATTYMLPHGTRDVSSELADDFKSQVLCRCVRCHEDITHVRDVQSNDARVLVIGVHSDPHGNKTTNVSFPDSLVVCGGVYTLTGLVCHSGTASGGHYVACRVLRDTQRYTFNDGVRTVAESCSQYEPYLAYYVRV